ncbi:MAG: hypothetical protein JWP97_2514 [Labilithrix sp.]|nr:hypothetical protein [Labilithrix sp.]
MSARAGWLALFGPAVLRKLGIDYPQRPVLEFAAGTGATVDIVDDGVEAVRVTIGASGGAAPAGSGFVTVTSGVQNSAASPAAAGVLAFLQTPSSTNLLAAMTDETGSGSLAFSDSPSFVTPRLWNGAKTFRYTFATSAIAADRAVTLPALTADDVFVFAGFAQTLTNKTLSASSNTITDTSAALGDLLYFNGTKFVRLARGTTGQVLTATSTTIQWAAAAGSGGLGTNVSSGAGYIAIGAAPAAAGALRLTNAEYIYSKDGGANDRQLLGLDASGYIQIGAGLIQCAIGLDDLILGTPFGQILRASTAQATFAVPVEGNLYGAVDGMATIAISSANITLVQAQYGTRVQKFTGAPAAVRTITYPLPADDAHSYVRTVWVNTTTANSITFTNGGGATVVFAGNTSVAHQLIFTPAGVFQVT